MEFFYVNLFGSLFPTNDRILFNEIDARSKMRIKPGKFVKYIAISFIRVS